VAYVARQRFEIETARLSARLWGEPSSFDDFPIPQAFPFHAEWRRVRRPTSHFLQSGWLGRPLRCAHPHVRGNDLSRFWSLIAGRVIAAMPNRSNEERTKIANAIFAENRTQYLQWCCEAPSYPYQVQWRGYSAITLNISELSALADHFDEWRGMYMVVMTMYRKA
jgi:hypothetical protein